MQQVQVLVAGGGTAGAIAAIQAARAGATTMLVEMNGQLGGTMTTGGVAAPAYFWSPKHQIIRGIPWELVEKCRELNGATIPDFLNANKARPSYHLPLNKFVWPLVAEDECLKARVMLRYHIIVTQATQQEDGRWNVTLTGKMGQETVIAQEIIDCTGDANLVQLAGLPVRKEKVRQPGTLTFNIGNVNLEDIDQEQLQKNYLQALADGELLPGDFCYADRPFFTFFQWGGSNLQHIFDADTTSSASQTDASIRGRQGLLRVLRFVQKQKGCEKATVTYLAPQAAARDTFRIVGKHQITYEEYMQAVHYPDAVCYSLYFIDVHTEKGTQHEFLPEDRVPTIPLSALIPQDSSHIMVAGRTLSSDTKAHSALRVEASCMAMGQVAGAAAALAVRHNTTPDLVPLQDLKALLRRHQALVP